MQSIDEMARQRNVSIARLRGLEVATIPVDCSKPVDIGFYAKEKMRFVNPLSWLPKAEIRPGLFAYGKQAPNLANAVAADSELCSALDLLLKHYAGAVEWSDAALHARVNLWAGTIDGDSTGGERFLSNLETVARHLGDIAQGRSQVEANLSTRAFGPTWFRNRAMVGGLLTGFLGAFLLLFAIVGLSALRRMAH
ncbi:hypothetical protein FUT88_12750 [Ralstonia sp. TCR112]|uniref:hypothetical protein n=1 Tax=Ralstonia sp. TCR112 TaxID=2601730 RepID=UPI0011BEFE67|nr:hypothetical protein [Ralstonia sp. TCR112]TXD59425.1 hypothetical protein FUT88_12750 [Ralstonia sp. TCR112]